MNGKMKNDVAEKIYPRVTYILVLPSVFCDTDTNTGARI